MDEQVTFATSLLEVASDEKIDGLAKSHLIFLPTNEAFSKIEIQYPNFFQWLRTHTNAMLRLMKGHVLHDCAQLITCLGAGITSISTKSLQLQFDKGRLQTIKCFSSNGLESLEAKVLPEIKCNLQSIIAIDRVLLPPDMVDIILADKTLASTPVSIFSQPSTSIQAKSASTVSTAIIPTTGMPNSSHEPLQMEPVQTRFLSDEEEEEEEEEEEVDHSTSEGSEGEETNEKGTHAHNKERDKGKRNTETIKVQKGKKQPNHDDSESESENNEEKIPKKQKKDSSNPKNRVSKSKTPQPLPANKAKKNSTNEERKKHLAVATLNKPAKQSAIIVKQKK